MDATLFRLVLALKNKCAATETRIQEQRSLTPAEFHGLLSIDGSAVRAGDFAKNIGLSVSRASRVSTRLMNKGLVELGSDPGDRRVVQLRLTKKGIAMKKAIEDDLARCEKTILSILPAPQRVRVTQALKSLINAM